jgi:hypothetical protein
VLSGATTRRPPRRLHHHWPKPASRAPSSHQLSAALSRHNQFKSMKRLFAWTYSSPLTTIRPSLHLEPPYFAIKMAPVASPQHLEDSQLSLTENRKFSPLPMNRAVIDICPSISPFSTPFLKLICIICPSISPFPTPFFKLICR